MSRCVWVCGWLVCVLVACGGADPESPEEGQEVDVAAVCAKAAQCPSTDSGFAMRRCPSQLREAERIRGRTLQTSSTSDLVALAEADCLIAADGDCAAVEACLQPARVSDSACAGQEGFHEVCDQDIAVTCWFSGHESYTDCDAAGLVCEAFADGVACASKGACTQDTCDGDVLVRCHGGSSTRVDCRGAVSVRCSGDCKTRVTDTCGERDGQPACVATGDRCDEEVFVDGCEGDSLVTCNRGSVGSLDCSAEGDGFTCQQDDGGADIFFCGPSVRECSFDDADTCDDGVLGYCDQGKRSAFDCASIGASGCEPRTDHLDAVYHACGAE